MKNKPYLVNYALTYLLISTVHVLLCSAFHVLLQCISVIDRFVDFTRDNTTSSTNALIFFGNRCTHKLFMDG